MTVDCGAGDGVDCGEVLSRLPAYIDGEMDAVEAATFRGHLEACAPCLEELGIDQAVKRLVGKCCGKETAPEQLKAKVVTRIYQLRVEISSESPR
jgi:mycothiol system anti-sigma-R factor